MMPEKTPNDLGRSGGGNLMDSWFQSHSGPVFSQGKAADRGPDQEERGGALPACRAPWTGEGADAGLSGAAPGGRFAGNRLPGHAEFQHQQSPPSSLPQLRVWSDFFFSSLWQGTHSFHNIATINFLIAVWNICLAMASCWGWAVIWINIVLASRGLGVWDRHIDVNRHIKEIYGLHALHKSTQGCFTVFSSVAEGNYTLHRWTVMLWFPTPCCCLIHSTQYPIVINCVVKPNLLSLLA